jgi:hypothetical protein
MLPGLPKGKHECMADPLRIDLKKIQVERGPADGSMPLKDVLLDPLHLHPLGVRLFADVAEVVGVVHHQGSCFALTNALAFNPAKQTRDISRHRPGTSAETFFKGSFGSFSLQANAAGYRRGVVLGRGLGQGFKAGNRRNSFVRRPQGTEGRTGPAGGKPTMKERSWALDFSHSRHLLSEADH